MGGIVGIVVADDAEARAVFGIDLGDAPERIAAVAAALRAGHDTLLDEALRFAIDAGRAVAVAGALARERLFRALAADQFVVCVPAPAPGVAQGVGFGQLAAEVVETGLELAFDVEAIEAAGAARIGVATTCGAMRFACDALQVAAYAHRTALPMAERTH